MQKTSNAWMHYSKFTFLILFLFLLQKSVWSKTPTWNLKKLALLLESINPTILLALKDVDIAETERSASPYPLEPVLTYAVFYDRNREPKNSAFENPFIKEKTQGHSLSLTKKFSWGSEVSLLLQSMDISTTSKVATLKERNQTAQQIKLGQPLLGQRTLYAFNIEQITAPLKEKRYRNNLALAFNNEFLEVCHLLFDLYKIKNEIQWRKKNMTYYQNLLTKQKKAKKLGSESNLKLIELEGVHSLEEGLLLKDQLDESTLNQKLALKFPGLSLVITSNELLNFAEEILSFKLNETIYSNLSLKKNNLEQQLKEKNAEVRGLKEKNESTLRFDFKYMSPGLEKEFGPSFSEGMRNEYPNYSFALNWIYNWENTRGDAQLSAMLLQAQKLILQQEKEKKTMEEIKKEYARSDHLRMNLKSKQKNLIEYLNKKEEFLTLKLNLGKISFLKFEENLKDIRVQRKEILEKFVNDVKIKTKHIIDLQGLVELSPLISTKVQVLQENETI